MDQTEKLFKKQIENWYHKFKNPIDNNQNVVYEWKNYLRDKTSTFYSEISNSNPQDFFLQKKKSKFKLSTFEKYTLFTVFFLTSLFCFSFCFFMFPVILLKPKKFGVVWLVGSVLFILSFGILKGAKNYTKHLFSKERIKFTCSFILTMLTTLFSTIVLKNFLLSIFFCFFEILLMTYYTISYFPLGTKTLNWITSIAYSRFMSMVSH